MQKIIKLKMKIKKVNELNEDLPSRFDKTLRTKIDDMQLYFLSNQYKIDLEKVSEMGAVGNEKYNELYQEILSVLKKHK